MASFNANIEPTPQLPISPPVLVIGAGGHAKVVIELVARNRRL